MAARAAPSLLLAVLAAAGCARPPPGDEPARVAAAEPASSHEAAAAQPSPPPPPGDPFTASVRPILAKSCAPCHEPKGQMYEKLPFDNANVVSSHSEGVLKRLKGSDRETVERWITSLPKEARASSH